MSNRIEKVFSQGEKVLNVYVTAGYPNLDDTIEVVNSLAANGVDMIELGMPFSDPLADGPVIQESSEKSIKNGMTLEHLFKQVREIRHTNEVPILLMGYFNQLLTYGVEAFMKKAKEVGIDGCIIPDLPLDYYQEHYKTLFEKHDLKMSFLITPQTDAARIQEIAAESTAFLYVVSSFAITGGVAQMQAYQRDYFQRIKAMNIEVPQLIGFGIKDKQTFDEACLYADGAIIGSAFIKTLNKADNIENTITQFIHSIR